MQEGTLAHFQQRLKDLKSTLHHLLDKASEQFKTNKAIVDVKLCQS